jgi:hypothetical protein
MVVKLCYSFLDVVLEAYFPACSLCFIHHLLLHTAE